MRFPISSLLLLNIFIIYHVCRVYLTMIGQYKLQHDDEMTSKDDKSIPLICYMCVDDHVFMDDDASIVIPTIPSTFST